MSLKKSKNALENTLIIKSEKQYNPIEKNALRVMAMLLGCNIEFGEGNGIMLECGAHFIKINSVSTQLKRPSNIFWGGHEFQVSGGDELAIIEQKDGYLLSIDILSPILQLITLQSEDKILERDECGLLCSKTDVRSVYGDTTYVIDMLLEITSFFAILLNRKVKRSLISGEKPYAVVVSFDVDGYYPGQIEELLEHLCKYRISRPTFMVMACEEKEKTIYDPLYALDADEMQMLFTDDYEIGLHSSFLANDNPEMLRAQKERLEVASRQKISGHRSHYYRFTYPRTWGYCIEAGFVYDTSLGWPDCAGLRNGTGVPIPIYHPDGYDQKLWYLPTEILDQHMAMKDTSFLWKESGKDGIDKMLKRLKEIGGILVLDWHVHGFRNEQFPGIYDAFDYILEQAERDDALICGVEEIVKSMEKEWQALYADELEFSAAVRNAHFARDYKTETENYYAVFDSAKENIDSIQRAADSLKCSFPMDVEKILDIGCGSGMMNRGIPPFYRVLCCDLTEDILKMTGRPGIVGDILDIPLKNKSVCMSMACDILEHLQIEDLPKAMKELERVSRKYIYIQVPLEENLEEGNVLCNHCGFQWHINYHKNSFTVEELIELVPVGWSVVDINYTGEIRYEERTLSRIKGKWKGSASRIGGVVCPNCGKQVKQNESMELLAGSIYKYTEVVSELVPHYSEIGILLKKGEYKNLERELSPRKGALKMESLKMSELDFSRPFYKGWSVNYATPIPYLITNALYDKEDENGISFVASEKASGVATFAFPYVWEFDDCVDIEYNGCDKVDEVYAENIYGKLSKLRKSEQRDKHIYYVIPDECANCKIVIQLVVSEGGKCALKKISLKRRNIPSDVIYYVYECNYKGYNHIEYTKNGVTIRYAIPTDGKLFMREKIND